MAIAVGENMGSLQGVWRGLWTQRTLGVNAVYGVAESTGFTQSTLSMEKSLADQQLDRPVRQQLVYCAYSFCLKNHL